MIRQLTKTTFILGLLFLAINCQKEEPAKILETVEEEIFANDTTSQATTSNTDAISFRTIGDKPEGWGNTDVGNANGSADINTCSETTTVSTSGFSFPNADVIHFTHIEKCGDFEMVAHINNLSNPGWAGIMIREDNSPGSRKVALKTNLGNFVRRDVRTSPNGFAQSQQIFRPNASWLKLVRSGNTIQGYTSTNGANWQFAMAIPLALPSCIQAGLFVEGVNGNTTTSAGFVNVDLGLPEVCDGFDNDCDGEVDEDFDQDGDGVTVCEGDCGDNNAAVFPGAEEICDGIDNNCNGQIDEGFDQDGDGYTSCEGDCDDNNAAINPGAEEVCDGIDNNCNGQIDDGFDVDGDGVTVCQGDCDDNNPNVYPGRYEACDHIDNNCDGQIDEGHDFDGDGYTPCDGDCDDRFDWINPGEVDHCSNGVDDDCDGVIDSGTIPYRYRVDPDGTPDNNDDRSLIAFPDMDQSAGIEWGGLGVDIPLVPNTTGVNFLGEFYTNSIVNELGSGNYAAKLCQDLEFAECYDWFLPSIGELIDMYEELGPNGDGLINSGIYWSSSEISATNAWAFDFDTGETVNLLKTTSTKVRCVK